MSRPTRTVMRDLAAALGILVLAAPSAAAQTSASKQSGDDLYTAGASVQAAGTIDGDAVLAGGTVLVTGDVGEDVLAAGGSVTITRAVGDDIRAFGGAVTVTDRVGGDAILGGGTVTLAAGSTVAGNALTAGGVVHLDGAVHGDVDAAGGDVVITGTLDGDVNVIAGSLEVGAGAVIAGALRHSGPRPPRIADGASVAEVVYTEREFEGPEMHDAAGWLAALAAFVSLAVCTLLFAWLLPGTCRAAAGNARSRLVLSLGAGLLTVIVTPVLAAALGVLMLTAPLAVALIAAYLILWIFGGFVAVAALGGWIRERFGQRRGEGAGAVVLSVLAAAFVYLIVSLVPFAGPLLVLLAMITGAGGLILLAGRLYKNPVNEQSATG